MRNDLLFWIDCEMSGLDPRNDRLLECAAIITDNNLSVIATSKEWIIHQSQEILDGMNEWNRDQHKKSGLIDAVIQSNMDERAVEDDLLIFFQTYCKQGSAPICGNSIYQDRLFLRLYMPRLDAYAHYRTIDVSSVKELAQRWYPHLAKYHKNKIHRALDDILESIEELRFYRDHIFKQ